MKFSIKDFFSKCDQIRWKLDLIIDNVKSVVFRYLQANALRNRQGKQALVK